jgi:hypothetical protein
MALLSILPSVQNQRPASSDRRGIIKLSGSALLLRRLFSELAASIKPKLHKLLAMHSNLPLLTIHPFQLGMRASTGMAPPRAVSQVWLELLAISPIHSPSIEPELRSNYSEKRLCWGVRSCWALAPAECHEGASLVRTQLTLLCQILAFCGTIAQELVGGYETPSQLSRSCHMDVIDKGLSHGYT